MTDPVGVARAVADRIGLRGARLTPVPASGTVNHVVRARPAGGGDEVVIRFPVEPDRDETAIEQWSMRAAARAGVPTPTVLRRGVHDGLPFLIESFVAGAPPTGSDVWTRLGRHAARIATIRVPATAPGGLFSRFGPDLPQAWRDHITYNVGELTDADPLVALGVRSAEDGPALRRRLTALLDQRWTHGVNHGDLHPRNIITDESGVDVLLDWGSARAGPAPWLDAVHLRRTNLLHGDPDDSGLKAFLLACGLSRRADVLDDVVVLQSLDLVRWSLDRRPQRTVGLVAEARTVLARTATRIQS